MKVVRIIARLNVGGPAKHVVWLSEMFAKKQTKTLLLYGEVEDNEDSLESLLEGKSFASEKIPSFARSIHPFKDFITVFRILAHFIRYRPNVVHTHTSKAGLCGRMAAWLYKFFYDSKVLVVHTYHGHTFHGYFHPLMHKLFLWIERFLAHYCTDKIITISEQQQFEILRVFKVGSASQHVVVPLGLDFGFVPRVNSSLREQFEIGDDEFVFGIVGRIAWVKNHVLFLEAVQKFVSDCKESKCRFVVVGDGDEALLNSLKKMANATGLGSKVLFVGNQSNPEDIYGMLNCLVLTSKNEGTPLAILEAFASSVPVVATRVGGVPDLLGDSERGLLVEQNADAIAAAMRSVVRGINAQILKDAKAFVEDGYSIESLYNNLNHLYKS